MSREAIATAQNRLSFEVSADIKVEVVQQEEVRVTAILSRKLAADVATALYEAGSIIRASLLEDLANDEEIAS